MPTPTEKHSNSLAKQSSKKRKEPTAAAPCEAALQPTAKKPKKNRNKKAKRSEEDESLFDLEKSINTAFAFMDPSLTADYLAQKIEWAGKDLSAVEIADLEISGEFYCSKI